MEFLRTTGVVIVMVCVSGQLSIKGVRDAS